MTIDEFQKSDLRVGLVMAAERIEGSEKLLKLQVDAGDPEGPRQILSGIAKQYAPEDLAGKKVVIIANLDARMFTLRPVRKDAQGRPEELEGRQSSGQVGMESRGMLLAAHAEDGSPVVLFPASDVPAGAKIT